MNDESKAKHRNAENHIQDEGMPTGEVRTEAKPLGSQGLEDIASQIMERLARKKEARYEIGGLLCKARRSLNHGEFMRWIEEKFAEEFSYQTAYNYMRIYLCCMGKSELVKRFPLTLLYEITAKKFPDRLREYLFEHADRFKPDVSQEDLTAMADKVRKLGFDRDDPELQKLLVELETREGRKRYVEKVDGHLRHWDTLWTEFEKAAKTELPELDERVRLTREQESRDIVKTLKRLGMMPEYELFPEGDL